MTSKERVRAAAQRRSTDRVPAAFEAVQPVWNRLMKTYGYTDKEQLYKKYAIDTRYISPPYIGPPLQERTDKQGRTIRPSFWGYEDVITVFEQDAYATTSYFPLNGVQTIEEVEAYSWPDPEWFDYTAMAEECRKYPDYAIVTGHEGPFQMVTFLMNMEEFFVLMIESPEVAQRILDRMVDFEMEYYRRIFEACEGMVDILRPHDDYGTQISLLFSVDMWRQFFKNNTIRLVNLAHRYGAFYQQHSCGAIAPLIPEFIDCGVDILEPLQKVEGMDPKTLEEKYGGKITFHGGIDTQGLLPNGTPDQVEEETRRYIRTLGKTNGYILMSSQNFETDIPTENIEAVYRADRSLK